MNTEYKISLTKLENVPITDNQCCINLTTSKSASATEHSGSSSKYTHLKFMRRHRLVYLVQSLILVSILSFAGFLIYLAVVSGYIYTAHKIQKTNEQVDLIRNDCPAQQETTNPALKSLYRYLYEDRLDRQNQLHSIAPMRESRRKREDPDASACKLNMERCKEVIDSMWSIVSIVNSSVPHLQAFFKNFSTETNPIKSKFVELVECLQCKNDATTFIEDSDPNTRISNAGTMQKYSDHNQIKNNVDIVTNLLNDEKYDDSKQNLNTDFADADTLKTTKVEENVRKSTTASFKDSFGGNGKGDSNRTTKELETTERITMEYKATNAFTEVDTINATINMSTTSKAEETTVRIKDQMIGNDDTKRTTDVTPKLGDGDVTKITISPLHPSVHPPNQGHEQKVAEREGENAKNSSKPIFRDKYGRIVTKGTKEIPSGMIPTAETIKSSQQLVLTPTISWVPHRVCFYSPSANNNPTKQSGPGQTMYPASSPGVSYAYSMQPERQGFQNLDQTQGYVQVQTSAQISPLQSGPSNFESFSGQRVGPSGPAVLHFPPIPGHQSAPANSNSKTPYYCTYIPAPTFQFPAIPGVSEYQRSSVAYDKEEAEDAFANEKRDDEEFLNSYPDECPLNTIRCNDGRRCVLRVQWCDSVVDCYDASDERMCSCRDRISLERLCDGYFDCPHGEDELGCFGCPKTSFSCNDWQRPYTTDTCVPLFQRCDGRRQCANGKDEMDCNILTPSYIEGKNLFTIGYTEGYLHKNYKGQWYPVCPPIDGWAKDACISEIGLQINKAAEIKVHSVPSNAYQGPYLTRVNNQTKLIPSCMNTAIFVRCPRFSCGTTVFSHEDFLRPHILEKEDRAPLQMYDAIIFPPDDDAYIEYKDLRRNENKKIVLPSDDDNIDPGDNKSKKMDKKQDDIVGSQLRVVGGRASHPKAWPFLVAIYKDGVFYCGGTILNELWVLTAAHCLEGYVGRYFEVQAGILRQNSFSPMSQSRKARYTVMYSQYNARHLQNDIGMIMLDDPLRFNRWVRPVCLPGPNLLGPMWRNKPEPNTTCIAIGWGTTTEYGLNPDHLREVEVPILADCKYEEDRNDASICAGYPHGGRDACQGDSGGPLLCRNPYSTSQWYVAGVVSHGQGCAQPDEPGTYARVSYFLSWIQEISNGRGVPLLRRTPLERCPGFSCEGGLGKCLPIEARCNRIVDCLNGEDEVDCSHSPLYKRMENATYDFEPIPSTPSTDNSMMSSEIVTTESTISYGTIDDATEESMFTQQENGDSESEDDDNSTSTTSTIIYTETVSPLMENTFPTIFTCTRLLQSIPIAKRCDRVVDCEDSSDEMNCTCKNFLQNLKPSAICDGYVDCDDLTDEQDCEICIENEFLCKTSKTCVSMAKRCDGNFDCIFKEDELDCFTLTDGQRVYLDGDRRPFLNVQGILTRYIEGKWQPSCHRPRMHKNQSTALIIGQNMCEYFGLANVRSSKSIVVKNSELESIDWHKGDSTYQENSSAASLNEEDETCLGLYIHCAAIPSGSMYAHLAIDDRTGNRDYLWPWLAAIFVDGRYRCMALLLDSNWLLSAAKCLENVRLNINYVTAVLGYGRLFRQINGPHQQVSTIDEVHYVNNSVSTLLHLKNPAHFSRHVQPLFVNKTIYLPGATDTCVAVGTNEAYEIKSVFLKIIFENCSSCQRCFVNISNSECSKSETSRWSGIIFCRGRKGWYPASVFQDNRGICNFKNAENMTSIEHVNPYLMEVIDNPRQSMEPICTGFRCNIGQCIPQNRVCDGIPDCRGEEDEDTRYCKEFQENCENSVDSCNCMKTQLRCRNGKCVDKSTFCDGNIDCYDGSDEPTICTCAEYLKLTWPERLCDGVRHCLDKTDESPEMCSCKDFSFKCETTSGNDTCIAQDFICDGVKDCPNGEDEATCRMLKLYSNDSSGEVIRRSYGVWYTECFTSPTMDEEDLTSLCKFMGYSSGIVNNDTVLTDEIMVPKRDEFYAVKMNEMSWMFLRNDKPLITLEKSNETCYRTFVTCS
ncbi:serine protease nudel isoform X2 [Bombus affinis]|uniref:serine protease nudel isoform X2 n=1 Tax=Bombus affinis TaxID=309941 RepID=UPI0021B7EB57|nr:serine protease nudel isoform X2 [Bombus affinis]